MGQWHTRTIDRLSAADVGNLLVDRPGMAFHVGLLARLEGDASAGAALAESVAVAVEAHLDRVPRLRQRVVWPGFGCGRPYWHDHVRFAIADHVHHHEVAAPGDEAALLRAVASIDEELLDRTLPLWQLWVLTGLEGQAAAVYFELHHAVADGIAAVATMAALLEPVAGTGPDHVSQVWVPEAAPSTWALCVDNLRGRARDLAHAAAYLRHPVSSARHAVAVVRSARADLSGPRAPRCSLNRPLGPHRSVTLVHAPLDAVKSTGRGADASVNDVVLAAVAGGLRALFAARGERLDAPVTVSVPMSTRPAGDAGGGNRVTVERIPVPVNDRDDAAVLRAIAAVTRARKRLGRVSGYSVLTSELLPLWVRRRIMDRFATADQRLVNLFVTNVAGPPEPLALAGRRIHDAYPVAPIAGNVTLGVAVLSYAGELHFVIHADAAANPDVEVMASGMRATLANLTSA